MNTKFDSSKFAVKKSAKIILTRALKVMCFNGENNGLNVTAVVRCKFSN